MRNANIPTGKTGILDLGQNDRNVRGPYTLAAVLLLWNRQASDRRFTLSGVPVPLGRVIRVSERPRTTVSVGTLHPGLLCRHAAASAFRRHLLAVPRFRLNTYGRRAFSIGGPMAWNSLPDLIRDTASSMDCFRRLVKKYLFARY